MSKRKSESGLNAALAALEDAYYSTDMTETEYRRRKGDLVNRHLDKPQGGLISRASHGDPEALIRIAIYGTLVLVAALIAAGILTAVLAGPEYIGGED